MLTDKLALLEAELKEVHKLATTQYFDIALVIKDFNDPASAADRIVYETTMARFAAFKQELATVNARILLETPH